MVANYRRLSVPSSRFMLERVTDRLSKYVDKYRGADKSLALPTSRCILFNDENISFDAILVVCVCVYIYIYIYIYTYRK
jgi:hypothetical protein